MRMFYKNLIIVPCALIVVVLSSCDTREDYFLTNNTTPEFQMKDDFNSWSTNSSYRVNIKDSAKLHRRYYVDYTLVDESKNITIFENEHYIDTYDATSNKVDSMQMNENQKTGRFFFIPTEVGTKVFDYYAKDSYQAHAKVGFELTVFENLTPVCEFSINAQPVNSIYDYEFDASDSYDNDERFGGKITTYEFKVDSSYTITTNLPKALYQFPGPGSYTINARVQDDNGAWSNTVTIPYVVQ